MTSFHGSWNLDFYWLTIFNQTVPTQAVIGLSWNFVRPLLLSQTFILSKLEFDSTTHVDKRTTFWCFTFDMKNQKNVENVRWCHKLYIPLESSQWAKEPELNRRLNLRNVQSRKTNFYFTISSHSHSVSIVTKREVEARSRISSAKGEFRGISTLAQ